MANRNSQLFVPPSDLLFQLLFNNRSPFSEVILVAKAFDPFKQFCRVVGNSVANLESGLLPNTPPLLERIVLQLGLTASELDSVSGRVSQALLKFVNCASHIAL
jgi:hypothetical protein